MKKETTVPKTWYECDQCGYSLGEKLRSDSITLIVGTKEFHFHGTKYPHVSYIDQDEMMALMFDHTKSCIARWFLAGSHIHAIQMSEGSKPERVYHKSA